jgi:hypothetical protein
MPHIAVYQQQLEFLFAKKWQIGKTLLNKELRYIAPIKVVEYTLA